MEKTVNTVSVGLRIGGYQRFLAEETGKGQAGVE